MRHLLATLALCATTIGFSQLPNGSVAPDFTITDIEGEEHNLYSYLDSGYAVIIDFSATWCGPCWNYHTSGVFEEIYQAHGVVVLHPSRKLFFLDRESEVLSRILDLQNHGRMKMTVCQVETSHGHKYFLP